MKRVIVFAGLAAAIALCSSLVAQEGIPQLSSGPVDPRPVAPPPFAAGFGVLHDQTSNPGAISTTSQNFEVANNSFDNEFADDFVVPAGQSWNVQRVDVVGVYFNGPGPADSFNVVFYADSAFVPTLPGVVECSYTNLAYTHVSSTFGIALPSPCFLPNGTHWVSVQANQNLSPNGQWGWTNRTFLSNSGAAWRNPGNGFATGCLSFARRTTCLTSEPGAPDQLFRLMGAVAPAMTWTAAPLGAGSPGAFGTSGQETLRVNRVGGGSISTCASPRANPGTFGSGSYTYDAYTFKNESPVTECVQVTTTTACTGTNVIFPVAYLGSFNPASPATNWLADPGGSSTTVTFSFNLPSGATGVVVVSEVNSGAGCASYTVTMSGSTWKLSYDVNHDVLADRTVWRPSNGVWYSALSGGGGATITGWGVSTDVDVLGDYDGDGKADLAVWRPSIGTWFIVQSSNGAIRTDAWGVSGDIPLAGDVDGDGKDDLVIFRPTAGTWFFKKSGGGTSSLGWGVNGDIPLLGDYEGDGKADPVAYRPSTGVWYIAYSCCGAQSVGWGTPGDIPVVGNWDGDARYDPAVFRPASGTWLVKASSGGTIVTGWGASGDVPVSGDMDGDGKTDFNIFRNGNWFSQLSGGGTAGVGWGIAGDKPAGRVPGS